MMEDPQSDSWNGKRKRESLDEEAETEPVNTTQEKDPDLDVDEDVENNTRATFKLLHKEDRFLSTSFHVRAELQYPPSPEVQVFPTLYTTQSRSKKMRILLVRHAQSIGNVDKSCLTKMADHVIDLSEEGKNQAREAGRQIRAYYESLRSNEDDSFDSDHVRLWVSPYKRARETARLIKEETGSLITDIRENIFLGEQQFGLFEGVPLDELSKQYPEEYMHFTKCIKYGGRFWARMPLGESRFDVAKRVFDTFNTFERDAELHNIRDLIIVTHGVTLRAFIMMWLHYTPEWFENEPNVNNCAIRLIEGYQDRGYIFDGYSENLRANRKRRGSTDDENQQKKSDEEADSKPPNKKSKDSSDSKGTKSETDELLTH